MAIPKERSQNFNMDYEDSDASFGDDVVSQNEALANIISPPPAAPVQTQPVTPKAPLSFADLVKLYQEKGATTRREETSDAGTQYYDDPTDLGEGWNAWEKLGQIIGYEGQGQDATPILAPTSLGGFSKKDGDFVNFYDTSGKLVDRQKWNEGNLKSMWQDLGPLAMGAVTMGGGAGLIGSSLFPSLSGAAAAGAGGALAGGVNAALTDQDILKGALIGGVGSAGTASLGDILGTDIKLGDKPITLGDVSKAVSFAQNPSLAAAINIAAPKLGDVSFGDGAISLSDVAKSVSTAQALASGDDRQIFNALVNAAQSGTIPLKSSLGPGNEQDFIDNLIPGYFQPGGAGYAEPAALPSPDEDFVPTMPAPEEITVRPDPANIEEFIRSLEQYVVPAPAPEPTPESVAPEPTPEQFDQDNQDAIDRYIRELIPESSDDELGYLTGNKPEPMPEPEPEPVQPEQYDQDNQDAIDKIEQEVADEQYDQDNQDAIDRYIRELTSEEIPELVMKGDRDKTQEHVFDPTFGGVLPLDNLPYLPTDDDFVPTNEIEVPETPTTPVKTPKVPTPTKAPTIRAPTAPAASSGMDMMGLLALLGGQQQPMQQAPMQDPYAHIKLMEDLFGSTIDLTPAGENTAQRK